MHLQHYDIALADFEERYWFYAVAYETYEEAKAAFVEVETAVKKVPGKHDFACMTLKESERATLKIGHPFALISCGSAVAQVFKAATIVEHRPLIVLGDDIMKTISMRRVRLIMDALTKAREAGKEPPSRIGHRLSAPRGLELRPDGSARFSKPGQG